MIYAIARQHDLNSPEIYWVGDSEWSADLRKAWTCSEGKALVRAIAGAGFENILSIVGHDGGAYIIEIESAPRVSRRYL